MGYQHRHTYHRVFAYRKETFPTENHSNSANWSSSRNELVISAFHGHQFIMSAPFNDKSLRHHSDDVGVLDRGQAVGNDDAGAPFSGLVQCCLHSLRQQTKRQSENMQNHTGLRAGEI